VVDKVDTHPVDRRIAALAADQHGVIATRQLVALGLSRQAAEKRVRAGRLHRVHRGVYAVGHECLTRNGRFLAAVLTFGEGAVLSHASAALLWELFRSEPRHVEVTVPGTGGRTRRPGMTVHRGAVAESERAVVDGIPATSPVRTLIDLADVLPRRALERALDQAAYQRLDLSGLEPRHGRRGAGKLARVLAEHQIGTTLTRSKLEELFLALCRREGLPRPSVNRRIEGHEVDFSWRRRRLIVETDGHAAHGTRGAFERDRVRDAQLTVAGWRVLRVTYRRLVVEPEAAARQLRELLGGR
jgi:very-short-patch-repair endonuclease